MNANFIFTPRSELIQAFNDLKVTLRFCFYDKNQLIRLNIRKLGLLITDAAQNREMPEGNAAIWQACPFYLSRLRRGSSGSESIIYWL
ncbi:hypothetical protein [Acinetobacter sp. A47]|uniref:hypothetical protein n=1 Tax=Acinetobacter sp. A47 TaxID=1561217 RepID=UPI0005705DB8|nr:hypothetical protein [Acinetobacter sp. A47]